MGVVAVLAAVPHAQTARRANWLTDGGDPQRTSWQRHETLISPASVKDMTLVWKLQLDNQPREMHNLFAPLVAEKATTAQGVREIGIVAGVSDDMFGIDLATGKQLWHVHFDGGPSPAPPANETLCPAGQTAVPRVGENTPTSFRKAMRLGATGLEFDVRRCGDGHDAGARGSRGRSHGYAGALETAG